MRRSARRTAAAAIIALALGSSGCSKSGSDDPMPDLTGTWTGPWTGPGSSPWENHAAILALTEESGQIIGTLTVMRGSGPNDDVVDWGTIQGRVSGSKLSFGLDFQSGCLAHYDGTAHASGLGDRTALVLNYSGVSTCGYPASATDSLVRLDSCPPGESACIVRASEYCADLARDDANCGWCAGACTGTRHCSAGRCETPACTGPLPLEGAVGFPMVSDVVYAYTSAVALADLNGDGAPDAVAALDRGSLAVLLGDGAGAFLPGTEYAVPREPVSLAVGDFDGDGVADLASLSWGQSWMGVPATVSVLLGNGDGTFRPAAGVVVEVGAGSSFPYVSSQWKLEPRALAAADLDGDGRSDLVVLNPADESLVVFRATDGGFAAPVAYLAPHALNGIVATDLDGDGHADIALGFATATLTPVPGGGHYVSDVRTGVLVFGGNGDGSLREGVEVVGSCTSPLYEGCAGSLLAADLNGDGSADLLQLGETPTLFGGAPGGTLTPRGAGVTGFLGAVADLDGDGRLDLLTTTGSALWFWGGAGDGSFLPSAEYGFSHTYWHFAVGDLDADRRLDVVLTDDESSGELWVTRACAP